MRVDAAGAIAAPLTLRHPQGATPVWVGAGALAAAGPDLAAWCRGRAVFLVSTPHVLELHGASVRQALDGACAVTALAVEEGEAAKSLATAGQLWRSMLAAGGKRDSGLIAFGGGSVGDLGGFVAGCFLRGIECVQIPTTLLAQVDAAIGGKTAVDLPEAKNSVGLFHHPALVVADTRFLATLPRAELRSGLVEVIKMAMLLDAALFAEVEERLDQLLGGDVEALGRVAGAAAAAKVGVVERDPGERGERRLLNLGHTLGHAIEAATGYRGMRHGEAVGYGLLFVLRLAESRGLDLAIAARVRRLLERCELPPLPPLDRGELLRLVGRDKKARQRGLAWILPRGLCAGWSAEVVPMVELERELEEFLAAPFAPRRPGSGPA